MDATKRRKFKINAANCESCAKDTKDKMNGMFANIEHSIGKHTTRIQRMSP